MTKLKKFLTKYKKECVAILVFVVCLGIFSVSYAFAAVEPVRSIVIQSENTDFASGEEGSWQVTKSGYWTNYGEAEVTLDVDTTLMTNNQYTDIIFVLDISGSMSGEKLDRVKNDSKELISSLLSNQNNRAALITFDTESQIVSELTNDEEQLTNEIDNLQVTGSTNYYQALVNVDTLLQDYQKEDNREMIVLFLTDGYPCVDTPNQIAQYQYLKSAYPYLTINGIQYEMGSSILSTIKEISDNQFIADMETLNNVLFDASVAPVTYDTYQIVDYIDNENFYLESINDINVTTGKVELIDENGKQKITWTLDNLASGRAANLTMKLKLKDELVGQGGIYPTNESTEVISKIEEQEDVTTTNTPILSDNYQVIYDGNAPDGSTVTNVPSNTSYSVFSTIEISNQEPSCPGYEFKGWTITTNDVTRVSEDYFIMPESDVIIKAEWSKVGITKSMNGTVNNMGDPIMKRYTYDSNTDYHSSTYKNKITSIVTKDNMEIPSTAIESWDVSKAGDGSVIAYIEDDGRGTGTYKVTIGAQGNIIASSGNYLFYNFLKVESIDLTYLDTSQVTDMSYMFANCSSLTNLDLSSFDTSQVTDMSWMFYVCSSLTNLNLSSFDTSQVTDMSGMFGGCNSLINLDLSTFNTSQVTDMSSMFRSCSSLTNLDLSKFDTSKVIDMHYMFYLCSSLTSLDISTFDTSQVTNMDAMFSGNLNDVSYPMSLTSIIIGDKFKTSNVTNMGYMFNQCTHLTELDLSGFDTSKVTNMRKMFSFCGGLTNLDLSGFDTRQVTDMSYMFRSCRTLKSIDFGINWDTSQVTDMSSMFCGCSSLEDEEMQEIIKLLDTHQVTDMSSMFAACDNLTSIDLSSFDTSQVTDMNYMFSSSNNLTIINFGVNWDTSQVTDMHSMFESCSSLTNLDLSGFDTSQVTDMSHMFYDCFKLTSLNLSSFDTHQVTDMSHMFYRCWDLVTLDVSKFDTSKVTRMRSMFRGCESLTSLDVSNFNTSQVTSMTYMFSDCSSLSSLDVSNFNTSQVTTMQAMFSDCSNLTSLDLSNFDTSEVTVMINMFYDCSNLTTLDLSSFDTHQVTNMQSMFSGCSKLHSLDMRNAIFNATNYSYMFQAVSNGINIIVKDEPAKAWIEARLRDESIAGTVTIASV